MKIIDEAVLAEVRAMPCEWCGEDPPSDPHHLYARGMGGGSRLDILWNLAALCRDCHTLFQGKDQAELIAIVWKREIWRILRAPKNSQKSANSSLT